MKKCLIVCLAVGLSFLIVAEARAFELNELLRYLGDSEGVLVVYVDDKIIIDDPDEIKICFLPEAQKYQGFSVEELFDKTLETMPMLPEMVLVATVLNVRSFTWMFFYTQALDCRRRA